MRHDLLSLQPDDLASISNRGNVNRATKELDRGKVKWTLTDEDETIVVEWSDGPTTTIPAGSTVSEAICSCPATSVCRHIVRAVLAYQREMASVETETAVDVGPWNPGDIRDDALAQSFRANTLTRWRKLYEEPPGLVVELVRSAKPIARFHRLGHTIRFLVPDDARYTRCDCDEAAPCRHVPLAIWAFRDLAADRHGGVIETTGAEPTRPIPPLDDAVDNLDRLAQTGLADTPSSRVDRWKANERALRDEGCVWPAEVVSDLIRQWSYYHDHDARFSPSRVASLAGEFLIRRDALAAEEIPIPRLFVRGEVRDDTARLGQTRLIGIGTAAVVRHGAVDLVALLQDTKSGKVMSFTDTFPDPPPGSPRHASTFSELARKPVLKGRDYATLGRSQVVVKSVRLNPDHSLALGRSAASAYAQEYAWENLLAPLLCESLAELRVHIEARPPRSLRPRRVGEEMVVLPVGEYRDARFDERSQALRVTLVDAEGDSTELVHPYSHRGRSGLERALNWLQSGRRLEFVAARGRLSASGLVLEPTGLVFVTDSGRAMVQPWVDDMDDYLEASEVAITAQEADRDALDAYREELAQTLGSALIVGVGQRDQSALGRLRELAEALHLSTHVGPLERLSDGDDEAFLDLLVAAQLAQELG